MAQQICAVSMLCDILLNTRIALESLINFHIARVVEGQGKSVRRIHPCRLTDTQKSEENHLHLFFCGRTASHNPLFHGTRGIFDDL